MKQLVHITDPRKVGKPQEVFNAQGRHSACRGNGKNGSLGKRLSFVSFRKNPSKSRPVNPQGLLVSGLSLFLVLPNPGAGLVRNFETISISTRSSLPL